MCVLCNKVSGLLRWYSDVAITHTNTKAHTAHSGASRLTHPYKYIFTPPVICSSYFYYIKWNHSLISKIYFPVSFLFKNYSLVKVIYLLIRCYKTGFFLWNTDNTDRNGVNKQNTCTNQTLRERYRKGLVSMKIRDTPFFKKQPHLFCQPLHFIGRNIGTPPLFFQKFHLPATYLAVSTMF